MVLTDGSLSLGFQSFHLQVCMGATPEPLQLELSDCSPLPTNTSMHGSGTTSQLSQLHYHSTASGLPDAKSPMVHTQPIFAPSARGHQHPVSPIVPTQAQFTLPTFPTAGSIHHHGITPYSAFWLCTYLL